MAERLAWAWVPPAPPRARVNWRAHIVGRRAGALCGFRSQFLVVLPKHAYGQLTRDHLCQRCVRQARSRYGKQKRQGGAGISGAADPTWLPEEELERIEERAAELRRRAEQELHLARDVAALVVELRRARHELARLRSEREEAMTGVQRL